MTEQNLRRHLDEAHRQLLERDNAYRFHEEEIERLREQLVDLREQLVLTEAWARELEANTREMQATRAWRIAVWLRSLRAGVPRLLRPGR